MKAVDDEWCRSIHERLLAADPTAPAELAEAVGDVIFEKLRRHHPDGDPDLIRDAAWDAIRDYIQRPAGFDPSKRSLVGYLLMAAEGDLRNALAKARRRREDQLGVELVDSGGKRRLEQIEARLDAARIRPELERYIPDPADREAVELMLDGERSTAAFAGVWGFSDLSPEEQRKEVKRRKDRLKKTLDRLAQRLRGRRR